MEKCSVMEKCFDKIILHLNKKKPKKTWNSDTPQKPVITINDITNYKDPFIYKDPYIQMIVDYHYHHMTITYTPYKQNPYKVWIEDQCVINQTIGTHYYEDVWHTQEDVIEYIRYKLR